MPAFLNRTGRDSAERLATCEVRVNMLKHNLGGSVGGKRAIPEVRDDAEGFLASLGMTGGRGRAGTKLALHSNGEAAQWRKAAVTRDWNQLRGAAAQNRRFKMIAMTCPR
jgi:hypothetical protein